MRSIRFVYEVILAVVFASAVVPTLYAEPAAPDLNHVSAYSLYVTKNGPREGYFPLAVQHGDTDLFTHAGFNLTESMTADIGWRAGKPLRPPPQPHGTMYFYSICADHCSMLPTWMSTSSRRSMWSILPSAIQTMRSLTSSIL